MLLFYILDGVSPLNTMSITIHQESSLTNGKNKVRFVQALTMYMEHAGIDDDDCCFAHLEG